MDFAICTLDNSVCNAYDFSKLSDSEISQKRKHLICKNCKAKAYFKKNQKVVKLLVLVLDLIIMVVL